MTVRAAIDLGGSFNSPFGDTLTVGGMISILVSAAITVAGIVMVFLIVGGGIAMISGAGNNDPRSTAQGKQAVTYAIIGFLIIFTAFWIVRIIELITGTTFITNPWADLVGNSP